MNSSKLENAMPFIQLGSIILGAVYGTIQLVDTLKNSDKRAAITGRAMGDQLADRAEKKGWYIVCGRKFDIKSGKWLD